jgi:hypothetical protein
MWNVNEWLRHEKTYRDVGLREGFLVGRREGFLLGWSVGILVLIMPAYIAVRESRVEMIAIRLVV